MIQHKVEISKEWIERVKRNWAEVEGYDENDLVVVEVRGSNTQLVGIALLPREFAATYSDDDNWTYTIKEIEVLESVEKKTCGWCGIGISGEYEEGADPSVYYHPYCYKKATSESYHL